MSDSTPSTEARLDNMSTTASVTATSASLDPITPDLIIDVAGTQPNNLATTVPRASLMALPQELRDQIYDNVLDDGEILEHKVCDSVHRPMDVTSSSTPRNLPLALVCKQTYRELGLRLSRITVHKNQHIVFFHFYQEDNKELPLRTRGFTIELALIPYRAPSHSKQIALGISAILGGLIALQSFDIFGSRPKMWFYNEKYLSWIEGMAVDLLKVDCEYIGMNGSEVQVQQPTVSGSVVSVHGRLRPTASRDGRTLRDGESAWYHGDGFRSG